MGSENTGQADVTNASFDTSTDERFLEYYEAQSQSEATIGRFERLEDLILRAMAAADLCRSGCGPAHYGTPARG